jgi:hypothetical protein
MTDQVTRIQVGATAGHDEHDITAVRVPHRQLGAGVRGTDRQHAASRGHDRCRARLPMLAFGTVHETGHADRGNHVSHDPVVDAHVEIVKSALMQRVHPSVSEKFLTG